MTDSADGPDSQPLPGSCSDTCKNEERTDDTNKATKSKKRKCLIFLPYLLGILWTCLNPVISILTGELKCRGWYLDEHSIEIKFADTSSLGIPSHLKVSLPQNAASQHNLCDAIVKKENILCHVHGSYFTMAMINPLAYALDPMEEALVVVVPAPPTADWNTNMFHYTLLKSMERLADPVSTPWLAKTLIFVVPNSDASLEDAVSSFLDAYMGGTSSKQSVEPLPPMISGALLRNLVVLDIDDRSENKATVKGQVPPHELGRTEFSILPQGRRGVLPNLDLVFLVGKLFTKASYLSSPRLSNSSFLVHAYSNESRDIIKYLSEQSLVGPLGPMTMRWGQDLVNMGFFAYTMVMGPYPPHAIALDRGIDAITIQVKFQGMFSQDPAAETIQYLEYLVRALSNLHERLHHSYTLYLLPTPRTFVSHMEYFLPNVLVLLPLAVRGFGLVLWEMDRLDLWVVGYSILTTGSTMLLSSIALDANKTELSMANAWLVVLYVTTAVIWNKTQHSRPMDTPSKRRMQQSLQFVACVTAAYLLVPIAFAHTSLSYVPSLVWTPLLAFPNYGNRITTNKGWDILIWLLFLVTAPPVFLVPRVFATYTPFLQYVYIPLHIQMLLLVSTGLFSNHQVAVN